MSNLANHVVNSQANAYATLCNGGYLRSYSGPVPANADTPLGPDNILLSENRYAATAFQQAINGEVTANPISDDTDAPATGTRSFIREFMADGITPLQDLSVGLIGSGADVEFATLEVVQHAVSQITSRTHTVPKS